MWRHTYPCCRFEGECIQNNNNETGFLTALIFSIVTEQTIGEPSCSMPQLHYSKAGWLLRALVLCVVLPVTQQAVKAVPGPNWTGCIKHPNLCVGLPLQPADSPEFWSAVTARSLMLQPLDPAGGSSSKAAMAGPTLCCSAAGSQASALQVTGRCAHGCQRHKDAQLSPPSLHCRVWQHLPQ